MFELNFKKYLESLGAGSYLPTTWTNSEADPTLAMMGHPVFLPGLDFVMNNGEEGVPQTQKKSIVKHFLFKQNPKVNDDFGSIQKNYWRSANHTQPHRDYRRFSKKSARFNE
jgi:hypothetical protein